MKKFKNFVLLTTIITYLLIFIGGLVRVAGAGLGCPDWPKCFGRWIPPTDISQLPPDMDPSLFNFTLAWIEYFNRLTGVLVGLLILVMAVWAVLKFRSEKRIWLPSVISAFLVAVQGWQGSQVVSSGLKPFIITIHLGLAFIIVSLVLYVFLQVNLKSGILHVVESPNIIKYGMLVLYLFTIFQVVVGTQIRSHIETVLKSSPLLSTKEVLGLAQSITLVHILLGFLLILVLVYFYFKYKDEYFTKYVFIKNIFGFTIVLFVLQLLVGFILIWVGLPALGRVIHLWISSLIIGLLLILFVLLKIKEDI